MHKSKSNSKKSFNSFLNVALVIGLILLCIGIFIIFALDRPFSGQSQTLSSSGSSAVQYADTSPTPEIHAVKYTIYSRIDSVIDDALTISGSSFSGCRLSLLSQNMFSDMSASDSLSASAEDSEIVIYQDLGNSYDVNITDSKGISYGDSMYFYFGSSQTDYVFYIDYTYIETQMVSDITPALDTPAFTPAPTAVPASTSTPTPTPISAPTFTPTPASTATPKATATPFPQFFYEPTPAVMYYKNGEIMNLRPMPTPYPKEIDKENEPTVLMEFDNIGDDVRGVLYSDGRLVISGTGRTYDFEMSYTESTPFYPDVKTYDYIMRHVDTVIIEEGITYIGNYTFSQLSDVEKLVLPSSLKEIGENSFADMYSLSDIEFSEGLEIIGSGAFAEAASMKEIVLPNTVTTIKNTAFVCFCPQRVLEKVVIPPSVRYIGRNIVNSRYPKYIVYIMGKSGPEDFDYIDESWNGFYEKAVYIYENE